MPLPLLHVSKKNFRQNTELCYTGLAENYHVLNTLNASVCTRTLKTNLGYLDVLKRTVMILKFNHPLVLMTLSLWIKAEDYS